MKTYNEAQSKILIYIYIQLIYERNLLLNA